MKPLKPLANHRVAEQKKTPLNGEFAKYIVFAVMLTFFVGIFVGTYVVVEITNETPEYSVQALIALLSYIGTPVVTTIGFYCWKARAENIIKYGTNTKIKNLSEMLNHIKE